MPAPRISRLARRTVLDLEPYQWERSSEQVARAHGLRVDDVVRFDLNTSPYRPAAWGAAMDEARAHGEPNEYFDTGYAELTPLLGAYCRVPADHLVVGAGADEILDIVAKTFLDNGDPVVVSPPTYAMFGIVSVQLGAQPRQVPLGEGYVPDVDGLLEAARGAKILWHCNPNSPTGTPTAPEIVERLVAESGCVVVVDEAYTEFAGWSAVPLVARHANLVVVRTMSKAFGMAGMRLGWAVAQPDAVELLNRVRPPNSVSMVTARLGAAALRDTASMREHVDAIVRQRAPLADGLAELGAVVPPSVTNFLLTTWGTPADAHSLASWLESRGIVVRNLADHPHVPGSLRISVRTAEQNARLLAAIAEWRAGRPG